MHVEYDLREMLIRYRVNDETIDDKEVGDLIRSKADWGILDEADPESIYR